eukprot:5116274-Pyramimonas_sp.AAC.1
MGNTDNALNWYSESLRLFSPDETMLGTLYERQRAEYASLCSERAECFVKLGLYENAVVDCSRAIGARSDNTTAYLLRARSRFAMGQVDSAKADLEKLLRLEPTCEVSRRFVTGDVAQVSWNRYFSST